MGGEIGRDSNKHSYPGDLEVMCSSKGGLKPRLYLVTSEEVQMNGI